MCVAMSSQHKFCRVLFIGWWAPLSLSPQFGRWEPTEHRYWQQNVTAVFCYFCHRKCLTIFRYSNEKTYQINGIQCERWEFNTQHAVTMQMEYQIVVTALLCSGAIPVAQINTSAFVLVLVLCCFATQSLCYLFDRRSIDFFSRIKHGEKVHWNSTKDWGFSSFIIAWPNGHSKTFITILWVATEFAKINPKHQ